MKLFRAIAGNAVVWSGLWFAGTLALLGTLKLVGLAPEEFSWFGALQVSGRTGVMGGIAGTAFSLFIRMFYRGRRLSELSALRFGVGGAVVIGVFVPAFILLMRTISNDPPLAISLFGTNAMFGAVFGGIAAAASLKFAQFAERFVPESRQDQLEAGGDFGRFHTKPQKRPVSR
jgi:hypothetical protein